MPRDASRQARKGKKGKDETRRRRGDDSHKHADGERKRGGRRKNGAHFFASTERREREIDAEEQQGTGKRETPAYSAFHPTATPSSPLTN